MLILKRFGNPWDHADLSMFCSKVETYLRMTGLPYRAEVSDVRKAPKQKLPVLVDGDTTVCDSRDILSYLEAKAEKPLDSGITDTQRALTVAFRALVEDELYFHGLYLRWKSEEGWSVYRPVIANYVRSTGVPGLLAPAIASMVRRDVARALRSQGTGRHTPAEVEKRAREGVEALSVQLGDQPYFLGDAPRTLDATTYASLHGILEAPFPGPLQDFARSKPNLVAYERRMRERFFADPEAQAEAQPHAAATA